MSDEKRGGSDHALHYPLNGLDLDFSRYRHHTITGLDIVASQLLDFLHQYLPPLSWSPNQDLTSPTRCPSFMIWPRSIEPLYLALSRATTLQPHPQSRSGKPDYYPTATDLYDLLQRWHVQQTSDHLRHLIRRENHYINTAPPKNGVTKQHETEDDMAVSQAANAALADLQHVKRAQHSLHLYSGKGFGSVLPRYRKVQRRSTRDTMRMPQVTAPFPPGQDFNLHDGVWPTQHLLGWNSDPSLASSGPLLGGQDLYISATSTTTTRGRERSRSLIDLNRFAIADIPNSSREPADHLCDQVFYTVASLESIAYRLRSRSLSRRRIAAMFLPSNTPSYNQGTTSQYTQSPPFADPEMAIRHGRCKNCELDIVYIFHSIGCSWGFCGHCGSRMHYAPGCPMAPSNRCKCTSFPTFHRASNCPIPCTRSCGNPLPAGHPRHRSAMLCKSRCCMCGLKGHSGMQCRLKKCRCGKEGHLGQDCGWKVECRVKECDRYLCGKHCRGCGSEEKPFVEWRCQECSGGHERGAEDKIMQQPRGRRKNRRVDQTRKAVDVKTLSLEDKEDHKEGVKTWESIFG